MRRPWPDEAHLRLRKPRFFLAHGGLTIQVRQDAGGAAQLGVEVSYARWWEDDQPGRRKSIFFGRPTPLYAALCRQKQRRLVISDLLTAQARTSTGGAHQRACCWPRTVHCAAGCAAAWDGRVRRRGDRRGAHRLGGALLLELYGVTAPPIQVVPNGVDDIFLTPDAPAPAGAGRLICTATVDRAQARARMARAAVLARVPIRFIGAPLPEGDAYSRAFLDLRARIGIGLTTPAPWTPP
jgi:hypothetical protein